MAVVKKRLGFMPCPCCGHSVAVRENEAGTLTIACDGCDISAFAKKGTEAANKWRAALPAPVPKEEFQQTASEPPELAPAAVKTPAKVPPVVKPKAAGPFAFLSNKGGMMSTAELDGLEMQAGMLDGQAAASTPEGMAAAQAEAQALSLIETNGQTMAGVLKMGATMIGPLYPRVAAVYTPEVCQSVGMALGPLMAKYGIDLGEWGGKYKEELTAAFVCVPIAMATVKALKEDVAESQKEKPGAPAIAEAVADQKQPTALKPGDFGYVEGMGG
jgi:hypothetical protein